MKTISECTLHPLIQKTVEIRDYDGGASTKTLFIHRLALCDTGQLDIMATTELWGAMRKFSASRIIQIENEDGMFVPANAWVLSLYQMLPGVNAEQDEIDNDLIHVNVVTQTRQEPTRTSGQQEVILSHDLEQPQKRAIEYADTEGEVTRRTITVIKIDLLDSGDLYLRAWCHSRRQMRTFRSDRIRMSGPTTSQMGPPDQWLIELFSLLPSIP